MNDKIRQTILDMSKLMADALRSNYALAEFADYTDVRQAQIEWTSLVTDLVNELEEDPYQRLWDVIWLTEPINNVS